MNRSMRQLASEIVGICRAKTCSGELIKSSDECVDEIQMMMRQYVCVPAVPTEAMIEAHQEVCAGDADEAYPDRIRECWQMMIKAALYGRPQLGERSNG
jgi:hypothetical protein